MASLGSRKYGRYGAFDSYSDCGDIDEKSVSEKIKQISIVIEEDESEEINKEHQWKERTSNSNMINFSHSLSQFTKVKPSTSWQVADDRSSLSSHSSDNSIQSSRRKDKDENVRAWMTNSGDERSNSSYQSLDGENSIKRKPF